MKLKKFTLLTMTILMGCSKVEEVKPTIIISTDTCIVRPVEANEEAKCFIYSTCKEWEVDQNGKPSFCKNWPTGFKNYLADLKALKNELQELQPACPHLPSKTLNCSAYKF